MPKATHPAEVFGYPIDIHSEEAQDHRKRHLCPFDNKECNKESQFIDYPTGLCSVQYGDQVVALHPRRFLQDNTIFLDIADHHFLGRDNLLLFGETGLHSARHLGRFDYVMVKHKPLSSEIEDFVVIEFQTGQTTSTGLLIDALKDFMAGKDVKGASYGFGLNLADIWKRTFTQILTKGIALERWGHKIYWVAQEIVYQDFLNRYQLHRMTYDPSHSTVFAIYDLRRAGNKYELFQTRIQSAAIDHLFDAFRTNLEVPPKEEFVAHLRNKVNKQLGSELRLRLELD